MSAWRRNPAIYEINTWVWLAELGKQNGNFVELGSVPGEEWDAIAELGFDAVWLMGVWERSPAGISIANRNRGLLDDFRRALPDFHPLDNVGSPYCVRRYEVDQLLGGRGGLATARAELARRGMRLILDFVPNHVAPDHPWTAQHPEYFIHGNADDARRDPASFLESGGNVYACGRDPYFPAWPDVLQLNAFDPGLRRTAAATLADIAAQSDGVRCDMAMLMLNSVFERTWGQRAGQMPPEEYWASVIPQTRQRRPDFLFIAEAYWDLEWELQHQGFDFCYDKRLYDRLEHDQPENVRLHLCADLNYQSKLVRFLENHDEPRAASVFPAARQKAAALMIATLPGARLFHEGQLEGRTVRPPVFLGRRPNERPDGELRAFYEELLKTVAQPVFHDGKWSLCERTGWPDNQSYLNLVAWSWALEDTRYLIIANLSDRRSQARVRTPWTDLGGDTVSLVDAFSSVRFERRGDEMHGEGIYVELGPWECHFLRCQGNSRSAVAFAA
jgi:glycosidase